MTFRVVWQKTAIRYRQPFGVIFDSRPLRTSSSPRHFQPSICRVETELQVPHRTYFGTQPQNLAALRGSPGNGKALQHPLDASRPIRHRESERQRAGILL